ncbi:hypothetical protein GG344DRAFT_84749 [Lentinula edodes]|nr:hypothetical protein GG344DRAFT_84749 [Lentinula edodes]
MKEAERKEGINGLIGLWIIADQAGKEAGEYQEEDIDIDEGDGPQEEEDEGADEGDKPQEVLDHS